MRRGSLVCALSAALAALGLLPLGACSNGANDVALCQQLESARCTRASACGIDLAYPLHSGSSASDDVTACQLFYQDACLHGLVTTVTPTSTQANACLDVVQKGSCDAVLNPQNQPACSWLIPPDAGVDASDGAADVVDSSTAVDTSTTSADTGIGDTSTSSCDAACESQCVGDPVCITACGC